MTTLRLSAWHENSVVTRETTPGKAAGCELSIEVETVEQARELAAQFPASTRVRAATLYTRDRGDRGIVRVCIGLSSNRNRGEVNETGLRRYRAIVKRAEQLGIEVEWRAQFVNSYPTREAFELAVGITTEVSR